MKPDVFEGVCIMAKENQHWIPKSYLKAWIDPTVTRGSFIWAFPKDGGTPN
jgi:hypothetical protein